MTLGACSHHAEKQDSELAEASAHAASHAGCEQQSCVPKAWHLHTVHTLSSLLCAPCCCQSTWDAVGPPAQPGSTALEGTIPEGKMGCSCVSQVVLCGTGLFLPWVLQILCLSVGCRITEICFWTLSSSSHLQQDWHLCSGQLGACLDDA